VGKGWLKEKCGLEPRTNFFPFKQLPKTECGLDSGADYIREYSVLILTFFSFLHLIIQKVGFLCACDMFCRKTGSGNVSHAFLCIHHEVHTECFVWRLCLSVCPLPSISD
jgi:hypothetical protein